MRAGLSRGSILKPVNEEVLKFLRGLRAVREFTAEPIDDRTLNEILEVGRWTSTGGNRQPTEVLVVRDRGVLQKFAEWGARPAGSSAVSLLLVSASEQAVFDEGRMAERLALAARACGFGSVVATLKNEGPDEAKKLLGIPEEHARELGRRGEIPTVRVGERYVRVRLSSLRQWIETNAGPLPAEGMPRRVASVFKTFLVNEGL